MRFLFMPYQEGVREKTGSENRAIWRQTAMSLLCGEAGRVFLHDNEQGYHCDKQPHFSCSLPAGHSIMDPVITELWPLASPTTLVKALIPLSKGT